MRLVSVICRLVAQMPVEGKGSKPMSGTQIQDQPRELNTEYEEKLAQAISRHEELQHEMQKLISSWEAERSHFKTKIVQLEHSLVDAIERSSNPLRTTMLSEEKLRLVDEAKREWGAQWEAERNQLLTEINRLRSSEAAERTAVTTTPASESTPAKQAITRG